MQLVLISTIAFLMSDFHAFIIDRKEAVPLLVSLFFFLIFFLFSRGKLEIVPFLSFFFLLKAQTTKIEDEKAGSYVGRAEETWNLH